MKRLFTTFAILFLGLIAYAQVGTIENIIVVQRADGTGIVDIEFDLLSSETAAYNISLEVSFDGGQTYSLLSGEHLSGNLSGVTPGSGLQIEWDGLSSNPDVFSEETILKIIAELEGNEPGETITDIDGNVYKTVTIGDQVWMAKNLRVTRYNNGDSIPTGLDHAQWVDTKQGAYAISQESVDGINSDEEMAETYGHYYNWYAVVDPRGLCPSGWHVPTDNEWTQLTDNIISNDDAVTTDNVGNTLKSCRQVDSPLGGECTTNDHPRWNQSSTEHGTDDFGFFALPGSCLSGGGDCGGFIGLIGDWWTSTEDEISPSHAFDRVMVAGRGFVRRSSFFKNSGFSVLCIKDQESKDKDEDAKNQNSEKTDTDVEVSRDYLSTPR